MRTTLDIPEELLEEARQLVTFKSKTDTIILALQELIRSRKREQLRELKGKIELDVDLPASRRRPSPRAARRS
ncbi:MAG: type II toxin-antitoxin system VapB family antitoxin [Deltaproteobacteria bacterium]|nr:type II toxin-antitoxin system VapB family antitoxin [Deltaproteobacteria bacterium]